MARLAGVSRSAVSRTFTPGASVSEKTRQKVLNAAEALGYQVNIIARTMITGSSNFIGIVTAGFDNPFRSKLLAPLVHQLALNGFMPLLMNADDPQQLAPSLKQLLSYHVAGVIITSGAPPLSLAEEYLARKIPVTLINRHADLAGCDRVCSDNAQGAKLVADLFSRRGWRQVGFIGENRENFSTRQRYDAFIAQTSGMTVTSRFCDGGMFIRNGSGALMSAWAAAGRLIGYYEPHMNPWDALPGLVLMREAGGASNDFLAQEGIQRGNPLLLASSTLYPQLKKMIPQPLH
ncbi:LacI family DNA-binding transcriptional regulator [Klebsiella quasipneumoniae subsp. similipneumoniae]|uniref:inositol monophosphatase family protein n=2 Tax=Klebsiella pneumoniae complex TaxID=3390273 RepID=UPI001E58B704|nr:LacI family DNA-binding transcriptional regulator [Klebsiella quasipneumoniae subsp. similipneumoniae]MCE0025628.1 LacI family DNA-binding transcriptional regulator [Klebsiella quasipneumoniae subsp. similipneumoniae]